MQSLTVFVSHTKVAKEVWWIFLFTLENKTTQIATWLLSIGNLSCAECFSCISIKPLSQLNKLSALIISIFTAEESAPILIAIEGQSKKTHMLVTVYSLVWRAA